jgi:acyl-CoA thioester hydrolase
MSARHSVEMEVRDYECDAEGIVNNAVYLHYLEHARHSLLRSRGLSFMDLTEQGVILVVTRAEIDYLSPLRGGEIMRVDTTVEKVSRLRFLFRQEIVRLPGEETVLRAKITGTSLNSAGRPTAFPAVDELMGA